MSYIEIHSDWSNIKKELNRLKNIPNHSDKRKLDRVLRIGLTMAQTQVHVITGSLKESGKSSSKLVGSTYRGTFEFGGFSTGVNNPVSYAVYEQDRGFNHNFMFGVKEAMDPLWIGTIRDILRGK